MSTDAALLAAEGWFKRLAQGDTAWSAPFATVLPRPYVPEHFERVDENEACDE
jgi:hypothetical protein